MRLRNLGNVVDARVFEAAYPARSDAPQTAGAGLKQSNVAPGGIGLGTTATTVVRALRDQVTAGPGGSLVPTPGVVFAEAGAGFYEIGVPYVGNPNGGTSLSPIGLRLDASWVSVTARPGQPVRFQASINRGYVSSMGTRVADIRSAPGVNYTVRVPTDPSQAPMAWVIVNEQVTTDAQGNPTLDSDGRYKPDPTAEHGYINAMRILVLGANNAEVTVGHAATLIGPT